MFIYYKKAFPTQMIVTWVTLDYVNESFVEYGEQTLDHIFAGESFNFTDGGIERRKINIHRVRIDNLVPGKTYSKD